jgi:UDP-glucose 4-epimerase
MIMQKILVTGGAGYIGSFIVRKLAESGYEPHIVDNLSSGHLNAVKDFRFEKIDLVTEKDLLEKLFEKEKYDGVIHMASYIQMGESFKNPLKYFDNNIKGAVNLLWVMQKNDCKNFVLSSSAGVYGTPKNLPILEDSEKNPENPYGETKLMIEKMLSWCEKAWGLKFMAIRYFNAAGAALDGSIGEAHPEESHLIPNLIRNAIAGKETLVFGSDYTTPDGTNVRDYVHVLDLSENHILALKKLLDGGDSDVFNAGIGRGYSNREVIEAIEKVTGLRMSVKFVERRPGDAPSLYASIDKIKEKLGWSPKYGLKEIIESAYLWHKNHPKGYDK